MLIEIYNSKYFAQETTIVVINISTLSRRRKGEREILERERERARGRVVCVAVVAAAHALLLSTGKSNRSPPPADSRSTLAALHSGLHKSRRRRPRRTYATAALALSDVDDEIFKR